MRGKTEGVEIVVGSWITTANDGGEVLAVEGKHLVFRSDSSGQQVRAKRSDCVYAPSPADIERMTRELIDADGGQPRQAGHHETTREPRRVRRNLARRGNDRYLNQ